MVAQVRISLRKPKRLERKVKHDWSLLRTDKVLAERYSVEISNRFSALQVVEDDIDTIYGKFLNANNEVAEDLLPKLKKRVAKSELCNNPKVARARERGLRTPTRAIVLI